MLFYAKNREWCRVEKLIGGVLMKNVNDQDNRPSVGGNGFNTGPVNQNPPNYRGGQEGVGGNTNIGGSVPGAGDGRYTPPNQFNGYNQYGGYNNNGYGGPPKKSNTGLIVAISILSGVILISIAVMCLIFTGVLSPGRHAANQAASIVATEAPTISPATAAPAAQAPAAPPVQNAPSYNVSSNTTVVSYMYVANVKYSIYLRSLPEENDSNIITEIPLGTQVGFIENADSVFAKINYNGRIGYSKREYLSSVSPNTGYSGGRAWSDTMTVTNVKYAIYLRSTPSEASDANIIMEIPVGSKVTYLDTPNNTFYKISYGGTVGYSKQIYLTFD